MTSVLSPTAARLMAEMPDYYGTDEEPEPFVARVLEAWAGEIDALWDIINALRDQATPATCDDRFGLLSQWERRLGLPVAPANTSVATRRALVLGKLQGRNVAEGRDWRAAITTALGSSDWSVSPNTPGPNQITVRIPGASDEARSVTVIDMLRSRTPAHLEVFVQFAGGFRVGISRVGIEAI